MLRRRCERPAAEMTKGGVAWIPCGVTSNAQARISAIGKPPRSRTTTNRSDQLGNSQAGKTAEASWMRPPAATT